MISASFLAKKNILQCNKFLRFGEEKKESLMQLAVKAPIFSSEALQLNKYHPYQSHGRYGYD